MQAIGLSEHVAAWRTQDLWSVIAATGVLGLLIASALVRYLVWRPVRWLAHRMTFRRSSPVRTSASAVVAPASAVATNDPLAGLTFSGPEGSNLEVALSSATKRQPVLWQWQAPNGVVRYQVGFWSDGDAIASTVLRKPNNPETVQYSLKRLTRTRIEDAIRAGRVPRHHHPLALVV